MPKKPKSGYKIRSMLEAKETSTDPVCPNQHDGFPLRCKWPVRQKAKPIKRISLKQKKSASEQLKGNGGLMHVKNANDEHKTYEKPAGIVKFCAEKTLINFSPYIERPKNNSEKCVNKSNDKKDFCSAVDQLKNECLNLLGAKWLIVVLKQVLTDAKRALDMEEIQNDNDDNKLKTVEKYGNESVFASDSEDQNQDQNTSSEAESYVNDILPKCSDQNMHMQIYIDNLHKVKGEQEKCIIILKEFVDLCGQISGSMLHIQGEFKKLKRPFSYDDVDFSQWFDILRHEIESMFSLIILFKEKAKHHNEKLADFLPFLQYSKMTVTKVLEQKFEKNSFNESQLYKNVEATVQNLHYLGAVCRIIYHILMKLLVVKRLTIVGNTYEFWNKLSDELLTNFKEELIALGDIMSPEQYLSKLVEEAELSIYPIVFDFMIILLNF